MRVDAQFFGLDRTGGTLVLLDYLSRAVERGDEVHLTTLGTPDDRRFVAPPTGATATYLGLRGPLYRGLARLTPGDLGFPRRELHRLRRGAGPADLRLASYTFTVLSSVHTGVPVYHHAQHMETLLESTDRRRALVVDGLRAEVYRTANCTWVAEQIEDAGGHVQGIVTPGIDLGVFRADPSDPPADHKDPEESIRIVTLGKAVAWKGLVDVLAAASLLARSHPVELLTYGPDRPSSPPGVQHRHLGFLNPTELAELYRSCDVCVVGSWYESFPLPPLEAMACATPVVCTPLGTEDYAEHERNCLVVPPRDPQAIADAVQRVHRDADLRHDLVRAGCATASNHDRADAATAFLAHMDRAASL